MPIYNRLWQCWYNYQGRTRQRLSHKWLADAIGVSAPTLKRYLDNTTHTYDPLVLDRICEVLEIRIEDFFYRADVQYPELAGHSGASLRPDEDDQ